jgi:hypothetical protein
LLPSDPIPGCAAAVATHVTDAEALMTAKLDKTIKRELDIDGKTYTIAIGPDGVKVTEKGRRNGPEMTWRSLIAGDATLNSELNRSIDATGG